MSSYDLKSLKLPKLTGALLKFFTNAVENPTTRNLLLPSLLENGGIPTLRRMTLLEPPTFYPFSSPNNHSEPTAFSPDREKPSPIPYRSIMEIARAYRTGQTTPLEVAEQVLSAISTAESSDPKLNLFIAVYREDVLAQAKSSSARFAQNAPLSLLDGIPIAVKDEIDMLPYPTTVGTNFLGKQPANYDSTVVSRLRSAGAILVGKANMHEIGINPNGFNANYGTVRNPFNPSCDSGGSSSGSAACVAAGVVPVAIGADGGGSIRIPASMCGVVGLKATFGRISEYGAAPLCWSVAHLGPLSVNVEDTALIYSIIAGADPMDQNSLHQPPIDLKGWNDTDLKGLTAGIFPDWFEHANPEIVKVNYALVDQLKSRGLVIKEITIPDLNATRIAHAVTILSELAVSMQQYSRHRIQQGYPVRLNLILGEMLTASDYIQAQRMRTRALNNFQQVFNQVDLILTPATAQTAQTFLSGALTDGWTNLSLDTEMMRFIIPGNLLGYPAISFPSGYDSRGLPIGMQAMGRHWEENSLLRVAYNAEQVLERKRPALYFG